MIDNTIVINNIKLITSFLLMYFIAILLITIAFLCHQEMVNIGPKSKKASNPEIANLL